MDFITSCNVINIKAAISSQHEHYKISIIHTAYIQYLHCGWEKSAWKVSSRAAFCQKPHKGVFIHKYTYGYMGLTAGVGIEPRIRGQSLTTRPGCIQITQTRYFLRPHNRNTCGLGKSDPFTAFNAEEGVRGYLLPRANPLIAQVIKQPPIVYSPSCASRTFVSSAGKLHLYDEIVFQAGKGNWNPAGGRPQFRTSKLY